MNFTPALLVKKDWTIGNNSFDARSLISVKNASLRCSREHELISVKKQARSLSPCPNTLARVDLNQFPLYNFY
jgi:hypothetical protein